MTIHAQGNSETLRRFTDLILAEQPPMSLIEEISFAPVEVLPVNGFEIGESEIGEVSVTATPDAAVCDDCVRELFDPRDRRYHYPFINCTNCGPRYSIIRALPYDRPSTTMAKFEFCAPCAEEYQDSDNRRFHAQPNACDDCGPQLSFIDTSFIDAGGNAVTQDPVVVTADLISRGGIVAVKGIGGFHLLCDARNPEAVARLRQRKQRPRKPFAVLGLNPQSLNSVVGLNSKQSDRLQAQDRPVLLAPKQVGTELEGIAPGLAWCGVMLPHTPIHYLLLHQLCGAPSTCDWLAKEQQPLLVMTSANRSGNPLITDNDRALTELKDIADGFLLHNRDIHIRCDDSVVNGLSDTMPLIRRGRGLAPQVIKLSGSGPATLAVGGFYKNTICISKGDKAYVSQYIGDLSNPDCCHALNKMVKHLTQLLDIEPEQVISDLHPDFYSSRFAREYAQQNNIPLIGVQHHYAHIAAVMAEHRIDYPVLGLALDGLGLGSDGQLWGGELLLADRYGFERVANLPTLKLPGSDRAATEPWRIAAGLLHDHQRDHEIEKRFDQPGAGTVRQMLERNINCPQTSSTGRLFDGVAALLGLCNLNSFEAEAAMLLESAASDYINLNGWPEAEPLWHCSSAGELSFDRLLEQLIACDDAGYGAALFHRQLIDGLCHWTILHSQLHKTESVALGGGCFLNQLLLQGVTQQLQKAGLAVFSADKLPCNDGGISLGQVQIGVWRSVNMNNENLTEKGFLQCV